MRLPDDIRTSVVYLGIGDPADARAFDPRGTGFIVENAGSHYLVTADHVADHLGEGGFCIRFNSKEDGMGRCHLIEVPAWQRHPEDAHRLTWLR